MRFVPPQFCAAVFLLLVAPLTANSQSLSESTVLEGEQFPQTRNGYLVESDVSDWPEARIRYAINEMFARHGAAFDKPDLKTAFSKFPWYKPRKSLTLDQIEQDFSDIEKENLKLLAYFRDAKSQASKKLPVNKVQPVQKVQKPASKSQANSFFRRFVQGVTSGLQDRSQSGPTQPAVTQVSSESVPQPSGSLITPGSERFIIKGLRIGARSAEVASFLQANNLQVPSGLPLSNFPFQ